MAGETVLGDGSGVVQQLLQDSVQDLTEELRAEVAVIDGDAVHFKPAQQISRHSPSASSKVPASKASTSASRTLASSLRSSTNTSSRTSSRVVSESSRDAIWLGIWGRLAALHESLPANVEFWQQQARQYPEAFAAVPKLEDDAWSKMVQGSCVQHVRALLRALSNAAASGTCWR